MSDSFGETLSNVLAHRPEIERVDVISNEPGCVGLMGWQTVVLITSAAAYVGKKGVDFLCEYLKDTLYTQRKLNTPPKITLYGSKQEVVGEVTLEPDSWKRRRRVNRWRWRLWNRLWWWRYSLKR